MLKLNDFINPELQDEGIALMRCLKNSLKRNIIFPSCKLKKSQAASEYETKLTNHNFDHKDLFLLFKHLYSKDEMSVSDRNLIRRILLSIFPEALISAGGKKLISFTSYQNYQKGERFQGGNIFYLLMKGKIKIQSPFYQRTIEAGMYFGHLQLLNQGHGHTLLAKVQSDASIICVTAQGFHTQLAGYFRKVKQNKQAIIPKILIERLQPIEIYLLCEEMTRKEFPIGYKINKKGEQIHQILFIQSGKINENYQFQTLHKKFKAQATVGFIQAMIGSPYYLSDNFTLNQTKAYSISLGKFKRIADSELQSSIRNENKITVSYLDQPINQRSKTEGSADNKMSAEIESFKKFMRIRKVNLPYSKTKSPGSETQQSTEMSKQSRFQSKSRKYEASFVFIKSIQTPERNKQARINRSFSLIRQQPESASFKRYLDHIDVPSLSQFKSTESQLI